MAATMSRIPSCVSCNKNGVFKSLFTDYIYENVIENYSQMFYDTFEISFESTEHKLFTICDECIKTLRMASEFKNGILAREKIIKREPSIEIENGGTVKIEKMWSYASSNKEVPLITDDTNVKKEETVTEDSDPVLSNVLDEDVKIEENGNDSEETFESALEGQTYMDTSKTIPNSTRKKVPANKIVHKKGTSVDTYKTYFKKKSQNSDLDGKKVMMEIVNQKKEHNLKME